MKKTFYLLLSGLLISGFSRIYRPEIQNYIMPAGVIGALDHNELEKVVALSRDMNNGKDPSFESVSSIFPGYMNYPKTVLGVREHMDRFLINWDGSLIYPPMHLSFEVNGFPLGVAAEGHISRSLYGGFLPVVIHQYETGGLRLKQTSFGYSDNFSTSSQLVAFVKMKVKNSGQQKREVKLSLFFRGTGVRRAEDPDYGLLWWNLCGTQVIHCPRALYYEKNRILDENGDVVCWSDAKDMIFGENRLTCRIILEANEEKEVNFRIPHRSVRKDQSGILTNISFDEALGKTSLFWDEVTERGMQLDVPEKMINNAYKTWHINNFLLAQENKGRFPSYRTADAPFFYESVYGYAASMYLNNLSSGGYFEEAKKASGMFMKLQREDGALSGEINVIPHQHGAIMYAVSQLYRKSRDAEWFRSAIPCLIKACDWIVRERSKSMTNGDIRPVTFGMLPPFKYCEDVVTGSDKAQDFLGNAWCWAGMEQTAAALAELGGEFSREGARIKKEADKYRKDIRSAMEKAVIRQNGITFLPMVITNKKPFDNLKESRLAMYYNILSSRLLESEIFSPDESCIQWIPDFLEKKEGIILGLARFGIDPWSIDPHFIAGYGMTNLRLGNTDKFLLTYYGLISYGMARELYASQEVDHIRNGSGKEWSALRQPHLHSTSQLIRLTEMMLLKEEKDEIWLAWGTPRKWLEEGKKIEVKKANTCYGTFDFSINSKVSEGKITADLHTTLRNSPSVIRLKLRHPEGKKIGKVEINGKAWKDFKGEVINIKPVDGSISLVATY